MTRLRFTVVVLLVLFLTSAACSASAGPGESPGEPGAAASAPPPAETAPATPSPAAPPLDIAQVGKELDAAVPSILKDNNTAGCSITVVYNDASKGGLQTAFFNYGTLSSQSSTPVDENTIYEIGSVSKLFAADVLAVNVGAGTMSLDDPLQKYLPENIHVPEYNGQPITLLTLATHTSGLPRDVGDKTSSTTVNGTSGNWTDDQIFNLLSGYTLTRAPGARYEYSNFAFALLGIAEERQGKDTFEHLVITGITGPLGMPDTVSTVSPEQKARQAVSIGKGGRKTPTFSATTETIAAGGLRSTARDLATYLIANLVPPDGPVGAAITLTEQRQAQGIGLAWQISPEMIYSKNGATGGFNTQIAFSKPNQVGYAAACSGHPISALVPVLNKLVFQSEATVVDDNE